MESVTTRLNCDGVREFYLAYDPEWDGFDSFVSYLQKNWGGELVQSVDEVYSRHWVVRVKGVLITVRYDSQKGNFFLREDGGKDNELLIHIKEDIDRRMVD